MLVSTIDAPLFDQLKHDQSLNVSFVDFVQHLHKILDSATKRADLHATLTATTLQFVERRSFRNLVHLALPIEQPTERFVLHYIQLALADAQQAAAGQALQLQRAQHELAARDAQLADVRTDLAKATARLRDEEARSLARTADQQHRLQAELQRAAEAHETEDRRHRHQIATLQEALDRKTSEAHGQAERLAKDAQQLAALRDELQLVRQQQRHDREEADRMRADGAAHKAHVDQAEHTATEQRQRLADLSGRLQAHEKQHSEMLAELEAERHIARTKRLALELATEEIGRANGIIGRQARELAQLAKKCEWRTEVALRQEQRIAALEAERAALQVSVQERAQADKENGGVAEQLRQLRESADGIQRKYGRSEYRTMSCHGNILPAWNIFMFSLQSRLWIK